MMIQFDIPSEKSNIIKVLGFGGGGGNAVNHMYQQKIEGVDFILCNTDAQALQHSPIPIKIQLGPHLTQGLGAGANPQVGRQATEESLEEIRRVLEINTKMAFITAGMGGGTGTGGAPIIAKICRDLGILTVGIVTTPFRFEGPRRMAQASKGIEELKEYVDTLLVISNDKLLNQFNNLKMKEAFSKADDVVATAARCITDVINTPGQINVDFSDVCTVMRNGGVAMLGSATASGENRAIKAIEGALSSPLLCDNEITGAKWILLNICSSEGEHEYTMQEVEAIQQIIREKSGSDSDVILGMGYNNDLGDAISITIIATGFGQRDPFAKVEKQEPVPEQEPPIVMVLGMEGEEKKMETPAVSGFENTASQVLMFPEFDEKPATVPTVELKQSQWVDSVHADVQETAVLDAGSDAVISGNTAPLDFELVVDDEPVSSNEAAFEHSISEEVIPITDSVMPFIASEEVDSAPDNELQPLQGFMLNKPSHIYMDMEQPQQDVNAELVPEPTEQLTEFTTPETDEPALTFELSVDNQSQAVIQNEVAEEDLLISGIRLSEEGEYTVEQQQKHAFDHLPEPIELSEEQEKKKRAAERIQRLRNLSFNPMHLDANSEFEQVPAYMRREQDIISSITNVEEFYSRAQIKIDDNNQTSIVTLNNFLHGEKPD